MQDDRSDGEWSPLGLLVGGLGPIVVACALVPLRDVINNANVALTLVVVVVLAGITGGRGTGVLAAVVAALSFDFFHTQPYMSLTIDSQDDVETTVLLLVVGLVVGTMASRARRARSSAELGRSELRRIHRLAERVAAGAAATDVIQAAQDELGQLLGLATCRFEAPPYADQRPRLERSGAIAGLTRRRMARGGFELPAEGVELAVLARGHEVGRFVMVPEPDVGVSLEQRVVAVALADQVGAALAGHRPQLPATITEGHPNDA
jgi:Domain of unknown function (DUF4118)